MAQLHDGPDQAGTSSRQTPIFGENRSQEWLEVTLQSIGDGVIATDCDSVLTYINPVAEFLTGWTSGEAVGQPLAKVFRIVNEYTRRPSENPINRALREGVVVGLANHTLLIAKDGVERAIDDSAAPIRDGSGETVGAVLIFRDVSEKRAAQIVQARLAALVDSSEDAIFGQTFEGVVTDWNAGAARLFGFSADETVGKSIFSTIAPPERREELLQVLDRVRQGEHVDQFETIRVSKDGRRIPVSIRISPIRDEHGQILGASAIDRDISRRLAVERRRRRAAGRDANPRARAERRRRG